MGNTKLTERLELRIDTDTKQALEQIAEREERSTGAIARRAIRDYVAREGRKGSK
jgi:predicted transcriptional regulator